MVRSAKNDPPWIGPYTIVRAMLPGIYTLMDTAGNIFHRDVPLEHLKKLEGAKISNKSGHLIDRIVDHRDCETEDGKVREYEVLWSDKSKSWESKEALDDSTIYTDYVTASRKKQSELPKESTTRLVPPSHPDNLVPMSVPRIIKFVHRTWYSALRIRIDILPLR